MSPAPSNQPSRPAAQASPRAPMARPAVKGPSSPRLARPTARKQSPGKSGPAQTSAATTTAGQQQGRWARFLSSLLLHAALLGVAGVIIVAQQLIRKPETAKFESRPTLRLPAERREHRLNLAAHEAAAPKPSFSARIVSTGVSPVSLPPMPKVNLQQMLPLDPSELVSDQVRSLTGTGGYGSGRGSGLSGGGGLGKGSGVAFFGTKDTGKSLVIMIDVSNSMFGRTGDYDYSSRKKLREGRDQAFQIIRDEAAKLIDSLGLDTRFGIIRWSGSARSWQSTLVPATPANKEAAKAHLQEEVDVGTAGPIGGRPGGTRHDYALEEVLKLAPEMAFLLTDGNATSSEGGGVRPIPSEDLFAILEDAKKEARPLPRLHTIYYLTGADKSEEEKMLRGLATRSKGSFRKTKAKSLSEATDTKRSGSTKDTADDKGSKKSSSDKEKRPR